MGHHDEQMLCTGKNFAEAERDFHWRIQDEYGNSYNVHHRVHAQLIGHIAPKKTVTDGTMNVMYGGIMRPYNIQRQVADLTAPPEQWLELWDLEYDIHS